MTLSHIKIFLILALGAFMMGCSAEQSLLPEPNETEKTQGVTVCLSTGEMLPQIVASRADAPEQKTEAEKKINTVHLFFFDADGNFLVPTNADEFAPYRHYDFTDGLQPYIVIPGDAFENQGNLTGVQIYVAVNIEGGVFRTQWTPDGDIVAGSPDDETTEVEISSLSDLRRWVYRPTVREDVSKLPAGGMPMTGHSVGEVNLGGNNTIDLRLTALMARVDVNVELNGSQENHIANLPSMKITEYGVRNLPISVPFFVDENYRTECSTIEESVVKIDNPQEFYEEESVSFSYYTYENLRNGTATSETFDYPTGVDRTDEGMTQRWKPRLAPEGASALVIRGEYWTHQELFYQAQFLFYLGSNTSDNFEVYRNRRYINNVTISGLDYVRNSDETVFTFDARVNVATDNPVYISVVNERRLDSHWCVLPIDVYFLESAPEGALCEVEISEDAQPWISLEYCDASTVDASEIKAGWGCRDYFTENMIAEVATKSAVATHNRDRIYFYIDENASTKERKAVVKLTYKRSESDPNPIERTIELEQAGLLPFTCDGTTYYMETYEEYAEHYDPLDLHGSSPWYQPAGIPWAAQSSSLLDVELCIYSYKFPQTHDIRPFDSTSASGIRMCNYVFKLGTDKRESELPIPQLSTEKVYPSQYTSAFHYACGKNKRATNGNCNNLKWILPGISELEIAMEYFNFPSFREVYYWSATPARDDNYNGLTILAGKHKEKIDYARATKLIGGLHVASGSTNNSDNYPNGGKTLRTQPLRVRAIRTADGVSTD